MQPYAGSGPRERRPQRKSPRCRFHSLKRQGIRRGDGSMIARRMTRTVRVGSVAVGGGAPVSVQSMTKTDTRDIGATVGQIRSLESSGCEIVRLAVPDFQAAQCLGAIGREVRIPIIADIHF